MNSATVEVETAVLSFSTSKKVKVIAHKIVSFIKNLFVSTSTVVSQIFSVGTIAANAPNSILSKENYAFSAMR